MGKTDLQQAADRLQALASGNGAEIAPCIAADLQLLLDALQATQGLHFAVWNGTPSDKTRIWMLEGDTVLGEIEELAIGWRWCWWGRKWNKVQTHIEARDALIALHGEIRAGQAKAKP